MKITLTGLLTIVVLLTVAVGLLPAQTVKGIIYPEEGLTVNGRPVSRTTAVFNGDKVQTGLQSAMLDSDGVMVRVFLNTTLTFGKELDLDSGSILAVASKPITVRSGWVSVVSSAASTKFEVRNVAGTLQVKNYAGTVNVNEPDHASTLQQGQSLLHPAAGPSTVAVMPAVERKVVVGRESDKGHHVGDNNDHHKDRDNDDDRDHHRDRHCGWHGHHHRKCPPSPSRP